MKYTLDLVHLYPDLLNLYGDRGNIIALKNRAALRGIQLNVHEISLHDPLPVQFDLLFLGGGQDYEQDILQKDLLENKKSALWEAFQRDVVTLTICGGYQMLGKYYRTHEGREIEGLGFLNLWTEGGTKRFIGNTVFSCPVLQSADHDGRVVAFENHSGRTYLGEGLEPLGKILTGHGNNGEDGGEGLLWRNVIGSYGHGSLLPKNAALTDLLLSRAFTLRYPEEGTLADVPAVFEEAARQACLRRFLQGHKPG